MASDAGIVGSILVKECKQVFEGLKSVVDVAGGTGEVAKVVAAAFPGLKCVVLDLPHVVAGLQGSENVSFVSGDMFDFIPHADSVILKWNLHMWSDEDCVKLLGQRSHNSKQRQWWKGNYFGNGCGWRETKK